MYMAVYASGLLLYMPHPVCSMHKKRGGRRARFWLAPSFLPSFLPSILASPRLLLARSATGTLALHLSRFLPSFLACRRRARGRRASRDASMLRNRSDRPTPAARPPISACLIKPSVNLRPGRWWVAVAVGWLRIARRGETDRQTDRPLSTYIGILSWPCLHAAWPAPTARLIKE